MDNRSRSAGPGAPDRVESVLVMLCGLALFGTLLPWSGRGYPDRGAAGNARSPQAMRAARAAKTSVTPIEFNTTRG